MAHDAVKVDTTMLSIDEMVERVLEIIQQVSGARA